MAWLSTSDGSHNLLLTSLWHETCFKSSLLSRYDSMSLESRILTDNAVLLIQQGGAVWHTGLLSPGSGWTGPTWLPGWGHKGGSSVVWGHQCGGGGLWCWRPGGRGVAFCQTGVSIRGLRGAVHPGSCYCILVVTPGDLIHRSRGLWVLLRVEREPILF